MQATNLLCIVLTITYIELGSCHNLIFPKGFKFGAASAAYQVEGAWNTSDKGENIWDRYTHNFPERIADGSSGDMACDSYHQWKRDIEMAKDLGLHFYRFSINWPRLLPNGVPDKISEAGRSYYNNLINGLLENGIEPLITLHHWELPQRFQDLGGWANPLIVDWFGDYVRTVYSLFGDRVKTWLTINEPIAICDMGFHYGLLSPALSDFDFANYICTKNVLMAHARAWRVYDEEFKPKYGGKVSVTNQLVWLEPSPGEDEYSAEISRQYYSDRFTHPIFSKEGGWPKALEQMVAEKSRKEGYPRSRLPSLSQEEIEYIRGTYDYFGMNFYTSRQIRKPKPGEKVSKVLLAGIPEVNMVIEADPTWPNTLKDHWLLVYPQGFRRQLNWIKDRYGDMEIMIMENGCSTTGNDLEDHERVAYYQAHLEQVLLCINEDKLNITRYTAWAMMDNFEWTDGYKTRFGLYHVDFTDPSRPRTPKQSAKFYSQVILRNKKNF